MELKANELRIGNYVQLNTNHSDSEIIEINSKDFEYIETQQGVFEPIPLTEEWLIKFGFKKSETYAYIDVDAGLELLNIGNKYFRAYYRSTTVKADVLNVHQFQNLYFALTGKELTHQKIN